MHIALIIVFLGSIILGAISGFLGVFAFLRQQSLLGDAFSHAMLPGIAGAFLLSGSSHFAILLPGAICAGFICFFCFTLLERYTSLKKDAILGLLLSTFFGLGLVMITVIQKKAYAHAAIIQTFFFGNAATMLFSDVMVIGILGLVAMLLVFMMWKELQLCLFDRSYAITLGYSMYWIDAMLMMIFIVTLALGLAVAGVILMSSLLVAPAAAARQWVKSVYGLCLLSTGIGAFSGGAGVLISYYYEGLPTGPIMVICLAAAVFGSLLLSPSRGVMRYWVR